MSSVEKYLLIRHVGLSLFRWGGTQSILLSGPLSSGYVEPLPLPSTIYGFLSYIYYNKNGRLPGNNAIKIEQGPIFYSKGKGKEALCVHLYPSKLICNISNIGGSPSNGCKKIIPVEGVIYKIGIALDRKEKKAKDRYIFMNKYIDLRAVAEKIIEEKPEKYGVLVKVSADESIFSFISKYRTFPFGTDSAPAKVEVYDINDINMYSNGSEVYLASPAIIESQGGDAHDRIYDKVKGKRYLTLPNGCIVDSEQPDYKGKPSENKINIVRPIFRFLSIGYNYNEKRLDKMMLAIMPGAIVSGNVKKLCNDYYSEKGWCSTFRL